MQTTMMPTSCSVDGAGFEDLMRDYYRKAYSFAYRMSGSREDAEDLTQEAFLRAYRAIDNYDRSRPFERWLFRIIANLFVDTLRARRRQVTLSLDSPLEGADGDDLFTQIPDEKADPANQLMRHVMDERIQEALNILPPAFRRTVLLTDVEGLSYEEAAEELGCAVGTVRSRLHRARLLMRKIVTGAPISARRTAAARKLASMHPLDESLAVCTPIRTGRA